MKIGDRVIDMYFCGEYFCGELISRSPLHFPSTSVHYITSFRSLVSLSHALPDLIESPFPAAGLSACPPLRAPPSTTAVDLLSYLHKLVHTAHTIA